MNINQVVMNADQKKKNLNKANKTSFITFNTKTNFRTSLSCLNIDLLDKQNKDSSINHENGFKRLLQKRPYNDIETKSSLPILSINNTPIRNQTNAMKNRDFTTNFFKIDVPFLYKKNLNFLEKKKVFTMKESDKYSDNKNNLNMSKKKKLKFEDFDFKNENNKEIEKSKVPKLQLKKHIPQLKKIVKKNIQLNNLTNSLRNQFFNNFSQRDLQIIRQINPSIKFKNVNSEIKINELEIQTYISRISRKKSKERLCFLSDSEEDQDNLIPVISPNLSGKKNENISREINFLSMNEAQETIQNYQRRVLNTEELVNKSQNITLNNCYKSFYDEDTQDIKSIKDMGKFILIKPKFN